MTEIECEFCGRKVEISEKKADKLWDIKMSFPNTKFICRLCRQRMIDERFPILGDNGAYVK